MSKKNVWIPAMLLVISLTVALPATAAPSTDTPVVDPWQVVATWWSSLWGETESQIEPIGGTEKVDPQIEPAADGSGVGGGTDEIGPQGEPSGNS